MPSARVDGHHPGALLGVAVLRHLVEVGLGEEARVRHQALVDRAELVDAELGVGDEADPAAAGAPCSAAGGAAPLQREVAEPDLVDERRRLGPEEVCPQRAKRQPIDAVDVPRAARRRVVPLVDEPEQDGERLVQVRAVARLWRAQLDEGEIAQPVEAVALLVLGRARRQDAELGRRLRVEQEEDAVQEAQRLLGERLRLAPRAAGRAPGRRAAARPRWR